MIEITRNQDRVTVIEIFRLKEGQMQTEAIARLTALNERISREPGWISAAVHRSFDETRIALYAQWNTADAIKAALRQPDLATLGKRLLEIVEPDWHLYEVVSAISTSPDMHR